MFGLTFRLFGVFTNKSTSLCLPKLFGIKVPSSYFLCKELFILNLVSSECVLPLLLYEAAQDELQNFFVYFPLPSNSLPQYKHLLGFLLFSLIISSGSRLFNTQNSIIAFFYSTIIITVTQNLTHFIITFTFFYCHKSLFYYK